MKTLGKIDKIKFADRENVYSLGFFWKKFTSVDVYIWDGEYTRS